MRSVVAVRVGCEGAPIWSVEGWAATVVNGIEAGVWQVRARRPDLVCLRVAGDEARGRAVDYLAQLARASPASGLFVVADEIDQGFARRCFGAGALVCIKPVDCARDSSAAPRLLDSVMAAFLSAAAAALPVLIMAAAAGTA